MCIYSCTSASDGSVNVAFVISLVQGGRNIVKGEIETWDTLQLVTLFGYTKPRSDKVISSYGDYFLQSILIFFRNQHRIWRKTFVEQQEGNWGPEVETRWHKRYMGHSRIITNKTSDNLLSFARPVPPSLHESARYQQVLISAVIVDKELCVKLIREWSCQTSHHLLRDATCNRMKSGRLSCLDLWHNCRGDTRRGAMASPRALLTINWPT